MCGGEGKGRGRGGGGEGETRLKRLCAVAERVAMVCEKPSAAEWRRRAARLGWRTHLPGPGALRLPPPAHRAAAACVTALRRFN